MEKPMVSCSSPVLTKTGSHPIGALAGILMIALTCVESVTMTEPGTTEISGPKPTVVVPWTKCVYWPVIEIWRLLAGSPDSYGVMPVKAAGVLVTQKPVLTISDTLFSGVSIVMMRLPPKTFTQGTFGA